MLQRDDNIAGCEAELAQKRSLGTAAASFSSAGARGLQIRFLVCCLIVNGAPATATPDLSARFCRNIPCAACLRLLTTSFIVLAASGKKGR